MDPFKVCTISDSPDDLGGGNLALVCLNGGGSLFKTCDGAAPLTHIPTPPSSMPVCSIEACRDANKDVIVNLVCRFSAAYSYPITCDFWSRTVGMQAISKADHDRWFSPVRVSARQELRKTIHMALQAVAPKHSRVHQRRTQLASAV